MVKALMALLVGGALWATPLMEAVEAIMGSDYAKYDRLVRLLFQNPAPYLRDDGRVDLMKVAKRLRDNHLLSLASPQKRLIVLDFVCRSQTPFLCLYLLNEGLQEVGVDGWVIEQASFKGKVVDLRVVYEGNEAVDPVLLATRFKRRGILFDAIAHPKEGVWQYRFATDGFAIPSIALLPGDAQSVIRPMAPVWIDVSSLTSLTIRELPGSHWHAQVAVYDKMLNLLSAHESEKRQRYLHIKLPQGATYVWVSDRYTLENLKNGLRFEGGARE